MESCVSRGALIYGNWGTACCKQLRAVLIPADFIGESIRISCFALIFGWLEQ